MSKKRLKNRGKKYNPNRVIAAGTQNMIFEHRELWGKEIRVSFDSGAVSRVFCNRPNEDVSRAAICTRRRWYLEVIAYCMDASGTEYTKTQPLASEPCILDDLQELHQHHRALLEDSINPRHLVQMGFTARPLTPQLERKLQEQPA